MTFFNPGEFPQCWGNAFLSFLILTMKIGCYEAIVFFVEGKITYRLWEYFIHGMYQKHVLNKCWNLKKNVNIFVQYWGRPIFNDKEVSLLLAMRSNCVRQCKANFISQYKQSHEMFCIFCSEKKPGDQNICLSVRRLFNT